MRGDDMSESEAGRRTEPVAGERSALFSALIGLTTHEGH